MQSGCELPADYSKGFVALQVLQLKGHGHGAVVSNKYSIPKMCLLLDHKSQTERPWTQGLCNLLQSKVAGGVVNRYL